MKRTAAIMLAFLAMASQAQALTVSANVGPLLKEAQALAQAGNYEAAKAKLNDAEAANPTPDDMTVITQMRQYVGVKAGDVYPAQTPNITPQFPQP